jgi:hypothetical protein
MSREGCGFDLPVRFGEKMRLGAAFDDCRWAMLLEALLRTT